MPRSMVLSLRKTGAFFSDGQHMPMCRRSCKRDHDASHGGMQEKTAESCSSGIVLLHTALLP